MTSRGTRSYTFRWINHCLRHNIRPRTPLRGGRATRRGAGRADCSRRSRSYSRCEWAQWENEAMKRVSLRLSCAPCSYEQLYIRSRVSPCNMYDYRVRASLSALCIWSPHNGFSSRRVSLYYQLSIYPKVANQTTQQPYLGAVTAIVRCRASNG